MAKRIELEIISPEGSIYKSVTDGVILPGSRGQLTVLPGHTPLFTKLSEGEIIVMLGDERTSITVTGGFVDVSENRLTVLADFAIRSDEIEARKAEDAIKAAEEAIKRKKSEMDVAVAEKDLKKYILELKMYEKSRRKIKPIP